MQWALYYPPIFAALGGRGMTAPPGLPPALAEAADRANQGDVDGALEVLDRVPEAERDAQYQTFRAALLLSVGQVDDARAAIERALARGSRTPASPTPSARSSSWCRTSRSRRSPTPSARSS